MEKCYHTANMNHMRRPKTEQNATTARSTARNTMVQGMTQKAMLTNLKNQSGGRHEHNTNVKLQVVPSLAQVQTHQLRVRGVSLPKEQITSWQVESKKQSRDQHQPSHDNSDRKKPSKEKRECMKNPLAVVRPLSRPLQIHIQRSAWDNYSLHTQHEGLQFHRPMLADSWWKYGFHAYTVPYNSTAKPSLEETYFIFGCRAENFFARMFPSLNRGTLLKPFTVDSSAMLYINGESMSKSRNSALWNASTQAKAGIQLRKPQEALAENLLVEPAQSSDSRCLANDQVFEKDDANASGVKAEQCTHFKVDISTDACEPNETLHIKEDLGPWVPGSALSSESYLNVPSLSVVFAEDGDIQRLPPTTRMSAEARSLASTKGCSTFLCVPGHIPHSPSSEMVSSDEAEPDAPEITIHVPVLNPPQNIGATTIETYRLV